MQIKEYLQWVAALAAIPLVLFFENSSAATTTNCADGVCQISPSSGFAIQMAQSSGALTGLTIGGQTLVDAPTLWFVDVNVNAGAPMVGAVTTTANSLQVSGQSHGYEYSVNYSSFNGALLVSGTITFLSAAEKAVDVHFTLPLSSPAEWSFWPNIEEQIPLSSSTPPPETYLPISSVTNLQQGLGLSFAIPPEQPSRFIHEFDDNGYELVQHYGLSEYARGALFDSATFSFLVYPVNPNWGLRDALRQYYQLYPNDFSARTPNPKLFPAGLSQGGWFTRWGAAGPADPQNYAFDQTLLDQACNYGAVTQDHKNGILSFVYSNFGEEDVFALIPATATPPSWQLSNLIQSYPNPGASLCMQYGDFWWKGGCTPEYAAGLSNSAIYDSSSNYIVDMIPVSIPTATPTSTASPLTDIKFPVNANPNLYSDMNGPQWQTVGKIYQSTVGPNLALPSYCPSGSTLESLGLDGIYFDSLHSWGAYYNHRPGHLSYETVPLTYDPATLTPAILNAFSSYQLIHSLRADFPGMLFLCNGIKSYGGGQLAGTDQNVGRMFDAAMCDILAVEGLDEELSADFDPPANPPPINDFGAVNLRMFAYQKPAVRDYEPSGMPCGLPCGYADNAALTSFTVFEQAVAESASLGVFTSADNYPESASTPTSTPPLETTLDGPGLAQATAIVEKYYPATVEIASAGWQPVPYAWVNTGIRAEVFGGPPSFGGRTGYIYFSLYNTTTDSISPTLDLSEWNVLDGASGTVISFIPGASTGWTCASITVNASKQITLSSMLPAGLTIVRFPLAHADTSEKRVCTWSL